MICDECGWSRGFLSSDVMNKDPRCPHRVILIFIYLECKHFNSGDSCVGLSTGVATCYDFTGSETHSFRCLPGGEWLSKCPRAYRRNDSEWSFEFAWSGSTRSRGFLSRRDRTQSRVHATDGRSRDRKTRRGGPLRRYRNIQIDGTSGPAQARRDRIVVCPIRLKQASCDVLGDLDGFLDRAALGNKAWKLIRGCEITSVFNFLYVQSNGELI